MMTWSRFSFALRKKRFPYGLQAVLRSHQVLLRINVRTRALLPDPNCSPSKRGGKVISVITGRGNKSRGGKARIKPAILEYLKESNYRWEGDCQHWKNKIFYAHETVNLSSNPPLVSDVVSVVVFKDLPLLSSTARVSSILGVQQFNRGGWEGDGKEWLLFLLWKRNTYQWNRRMNFHVV